MSEATIAILAFFGATAAQLLGHFLEDRRRKLSEHRQGEVLIDSLAADLGYLAIQLALFVHKLNPSKEIEGWWSFEGTRFDFVRLDRSLEHYNLDVPIAPGVINRVRAALHQANGLLEEVAAAAPCTVDENARYRAIDLLVYCARLSLLVERAKTSRNVAWHQEIGQAEVLEFFNGASIYSGRSRILPQHVRTWMQEIETRRDELERDEPK